MSAEIWQAMHVDEVNQQETGEITRGDVVLKDGAIYVVESVRDGRIRAIREDGVEVIAAKAEFTLLQEDELFQILEAKARKRASLLPPQRQGEMRYLDIVEIEELPRKSLEALVLKLAQRLAII